MRKRHFEFIEDQSSKFWEVEVSGARMSVCFGRIGTEGNTKEKSFGSAEDAEREATKLIAEKTKKGYVETKRGAGAPSPTRSKKKSEGTLPTGTASTKPLENVFASLDRALGLKVSTKKVNLEPLTKRLDRAPHVELEALWKWSHAAAVLENELLAVARERA